MRSCDGCTKCCEGWLRGDAHGHVFWPGRPCQFCMTGRGCEIYETRPDQPCKSFKCAWLTDVKIPAWMKPSECGVIIIVGRLQGHEYVDLVEAGKRLDPSILSWFYIAREQGLVQNMHYNLDGGQNWIGTPEFIKAIESSGNVSKPV